MSARLIRLIVSATYVAAGMAGSFVVVVALSRLAPEAARPGFFLALAVYFPLVALLSQSYALLIYRGGAAGRLGYLADVTVTLSALGLLLIFGDGLMSGTDAVLYALSIPASYRASAHLAGVQFTRPDIRTSALPVLASLARVAVALGLMAAGSGPAAAFLGSTLGFWLVATRVAVSDSRPAGRTAPGAFGALIVYFLASAFTFQWDRFVFSTLELSALITLSGVVMTWVLSPVSGVYAILSRAAAPGIFHGGPSFTLYRWLRIGGVFAALSAVYTGVLITFWEPLNALVFPYVSGGREAALILSVAMIADRLAMLALLMADSGRAYTRAALVKTALILVGAGAAFAFPALQSLTAIYAIYLGLALAYLGVVVAVCSGSQPSRKG